MSAINFCTSLVMRPVAGSVAKRVKWDNKRGESFPKNTHHAQPDDANKENECDAKSVSVQTEEIISPHKVIPSSQQTLKTVFGDRSDSKPGPLPYCDNCELDRRGQACFSQWWSKRSQNTQCRRCDENLRCPQIVQLDNCESFNCQR